MRKVFCIVIGLFLLSGYPVASAANPGAGVGAGQLADANWVRLKGKSGGVYYFAIAERYVDPTDGGLVTLAAVGKGTCFASGGRGFRLVVCEASGRFVKVPLDAFQMDPALASATLRFESRGKTHDVRWTGQDAAPSAGGGFGVSPGGVEAGAGAGRFAVAEGTVLGKKLRPAGDSDFSFLEEGAGGGVFLYPQARIEISGDRVTSRVKVRLPRS